MANWREGGRPAAVPDDGHSQPATYSPQSAAAAGDKASPFDSQKHSFMTASSHYRPSFHGPLPPFMAMRPGMKPMVPVPPFHMGPMMPMNCNPMMMPPFVSTFSSLSVVSY